MASSLATVALEFPIGAHGDVKELGVGDLSLLVQKEIERLPFDFEGDHRRHLRTMGHAGDLAQRHGEGGRQTERVIGGEGHILASAAQ